MALELLLREDIPLVTLIGKAGTGKTLLALAAGLLQTEDLGIYKKTDRRASHRPGGKGYRIFAWRKRGKAQAVDATNL